MPNYRILQELPLQVGPAQIPELGGVEQMIRVNNVLVPDRWESRCSLQVDHGVKSRLDAFVPKVSFEIT